MDMMRVGPRMCVKWAAVMGSVAMRIQVIDELVLFVFEKFEEDVMVWLVVLVVADEDVFVSVDVLDDVELVEVAEGEGVEVVMVAVHDLVDVVDEVVNEVEFVVVLVPEVLEDEDVERGVVEELVEVEAEYV